MSPPQRGGLRVPRDPSVQVPTQAQPRGQALPQSSHREQRSAARAELRVARRETGWPCVQGEGEGR